LIPLGGLLSTGLVLYFFQGKLTSVFTNSSLVITDSTNFILLKVLLANLITIVIISLSMIVVTRQVSHKIVYPIHCLEKDISIIAGGDLLHRSYLRQGDQFQVLSADINQMAEQLNNKIARIQSGLKWIMESVVEQSASAELLLELELLHDRIGQHFTLSLNPEAAMIPKGYPALVSSVISDDGRNYEDLVRIRLQIEAKEEISHQVKELDRKAS
jgi:methyl-accepting chemotaxis protein